MAVVNDHPVLYEDGHLAKPKHLHLLAQESDDMCAQAVPDQVDLLHLGAGLKGEQEHQQGRVFANRLGGGCRLQVVEALQLPPVDREDVVLPNCQIRWSEKFSISHPVILPTCV